MAETTNFRIVETEICQDWPKIDEIEIFPRLVDLWSKQTLVQGDFCPRCESDKVNPILPGGGALSATIFVDWLLLHNGFDYCIDFS